MMMHMGNDVLYFSKEDQLRVYKVVKEAICSRLKGAIRLTSYIRLLIEPMFAYNHFEDADELPDQDIELEEEEDDDDDGDFPDTDV